MITNETKNLIDNKIEDLFQKIEQTIIAGITEDMSPNDGQYYSELDSRWEGLTTGEAQTIKVRVGSNEIPKKKVSLLDWKED